MYPPQVSSV
ncbi:hypothetical protein AZE42_12339 [Rhizopogon vesiculosus]|uniref:Uncharacterized protein n=1 Tax=Rhizopogon vesiculosus TaxID=180088 RepID=A0A1J8Q6E4_9AGAM|nr:hypothetical protein AZE42_12339 [Rhizopogon vesiculosus]